MQLTRTTIGHGGGPTLGTLVSRDDQFRCVTLERSIDGDHPCIPPGRYQVHLATHHPGTPHAYPCPELDTSALVPPRTHIHIHVANTASELLGCIAVGETVAADQQAIEHSQAAFDRLMAYLSGALPCTLDVSESIGA